MQAPSRSGPATRVRRFVSRPHERCSSQERGHEDQKCVEASNYYLADRACAGTLEHVSELTGLIETHRDAITEAARQHKGRTIAVFGSVARGEDAETSDIDFLVEFEPDSSLFDVLHLQEALQDLLGRAVDVVSAGGLTDRDDHIRREAIPL